jgi:hypothetical protein
MYVMNLATELFRLSQRGDMAPTSRDEILERFEALRSYGRLPIGRGKRLKPLTTSEMASAILGMVPTWTGQGGKRRPTTIPVGGRERVFLIQRRMAKFRVTYEGAV